MKWTKWIAMSVAVMLFSGARAEEPSAASVASQEWRSYVSPLEPIGERLAGQLSDQNDAQLRQDMYRRAFSALSAAYMSLFVGDGEHPDFWPIFNQAYNFWAPNPDNVYYGSTISADGVYKISGFRGTRLIVDFQTAGGAIIPNGTGELGRTFANYDIDYDVHVNKDGSFEVILSPERPAGHKGDWWKLDPNTTYILVRQISYDWLRETDGRFAIERLDRPAIKPRLTAEQSDAKLRLMAEFAENWTASTARWVDRQYRSKGTINKITVQDMSSGGGLSPQKQLYIGGMFDQLLDESCSFNCCHVQR